MDIKTTIVLFVVGILGVFAQAFKKMNEINKSMNGNFVFKDYLLIERFNIAGSFIAVLLFTIVPYFVPDLAKCGKWLCGGQFLMGWFGLSILEFFAGQAKNKAGNIMGATDEDIRKIQNP